LVSSNPKGKIRRWKSWVYYWKCPKCGKIIERLDRRGLEFAMFMHYDSNVCRQRAKKRNKKG